MKKRVLFCCALPLFLAACYAVSKPETPSEESRTHIEEYLSLHIGISGFGGKVFCPFEMLGQDPIGARLYVWAHCMEYRAVDGALVKGTGSSVPVSLRVNKDGTSIHVLDHQVPNEGWSEQNIEEIFPQAVIEAFCMQDAGCYNGRAGRLDKEALQMAAQFFGVAP